MFCSIRFGASDEADNRFFVLLFGTMAREKGPIRWDWERAGRLFFSALGNSLSCNKMNTTLSSISSPWDFVFDYPISLWRAGYRIFGAHFVPLLTHSNVDTQYALGTERGTLFRPNVLFLHSGSIRLPSTLIIIIIIIVASHIHVAARFFGSRGWPEDSFHSRLRSKRTRLTGAHFPSQQMREESRNPKKRSRTHLHP